MKTKILTTLAAICVAGLLVPAIAQTSTDAPETNNPVAMPDQPAATGETNAGLTAPEAAPPPATSAEATAAPGETTAAPGEEAVAPTPSATTSRFTSRGRGYSPNGAAPEIVTSPYTPPAQPVAGATNGLSMNFIGAPLSEVLNYLVDAANFIIVNQVRGGIYGSVSVHGNNLTRQDCADVLNAQLNQNDLAAVFTPPRTLTIMTKADAKTADIRVITDNDPNHVPSNAEMVTQIIPIRFVDAGQLVSDLSLFVSPQASIEANTAGNSIIITDTQSNIHHLLEIIKAIDDSAQTETVVNTYMLKYASPVDVVNELSAVFPSSSGAQAPITVGGRGGGGRGGRGGGGANPFAALFGGGGGGGGGQSTSDRIQRAQQVNAVADSRIQAVIVTAPTSLTNQIAALIDNMDQPADNDQNVFVLSVTNADPYVVAQELQGMFNSTTRNNGQQSSPWLTRYNSGIQNDTVSPGTGLGTSGTTAADANSNTESLIFMQRQTMKTKHFKKLFGGVLIFLFCAAFELYAGGGGGGGGGRGGGGGGGGGGRGGGGAGGGGAGGFGGFAGGAIGGGGAAGGGRGGGGANSSQYTEHGTVGIAQIYVDPATHKIMVVADEVTEKQIQQALSELDVPRQQVLIRVVFLEVNNNKASAIGVNGQYTGRNGEFGTITGFITNGIQQISTTTANGTSTTTSTTYQPTLTTREQSVDLGTSFGLPRTLAGAAGVGGVETILSDNFTATLQAIAAAGKAQVLSRPTILAGDGQLAEIVIGQSIYLPSGVSFTSVSGSTTTVPTINGSYQNVGIQLDVTPSIQMNGLVQMIVEPQITSIDTSTPGQQIVGSTLFSGAVYAPNINKRSANTIVLTPDGQPVVIGGLISSQKSSNVTKVPILGDIPLFGQLFKFTAKSDSKTELDIFLTPHIVQAPAQLVAMGAAEINQSQMITNSFSEQILNRYLERVPMDGAAPPARVSTGGFMSVPPPSNPSVPNP